MNLQNVRFNRRSLTLKIILNLVLISFLLITVFTIKSQVDTANLLAEKEKVILACSADTIDRRNTVIYDLLKVASGQITLNENVIQAFANRDREELSRLMLPVMNNLAVSGIDQYFFYLPDNTTFFAGDDKSYSDELANLRPMVVAANNNQQAVQGLEQSLSGLAYRYISPVFISEEYMGSIELGINLNERILSIWKSASGGEWYLYSLENINSPMLLAGTTAEFPLIMSYNHVEQIMNKKNIYLKKDPYLVQIVPLENFSGDISWYIERIADNSELIALGKQQNYKSIAFVLMLVILFGIGMFYLIRNLLKPLSYLAEKAKIFANGDLSQPITVQTGDEIGQLAETMEAMRQSIQQSEQKLKRSEELFKTLADFATDWIYWREMNGEIVYTSPAGEWITGYSTTELKANPDLFTQMVHPEDRGNWLGYLDEIRKNPNAISTSIELRILTKNGETKWIRRICQPILNEAGQLIGIRGSNNDITESKLAEKKLKYLSLHDQLTGIYNRTYFEEELSRLKVSREYPISIISADLDNLKIINDSFGHQLGDELIKACAATLKISMRQSDLLARIGGDEFIAILPRTGKEEAEKIVNRIQAAMEKYNQEHPKLPLSISLGIATSHGPEQHLDDILKEADNAMYQDKLSCKAINRKNILDLLMQTMLELNDADEGKYLRLTTLYKKLAGE